MSYVHEIARKKGLPIIDAKEPAFIGVSVDDVRKASAKNSKCCAFARAAQKEPGVIAAYFFRSTAFIEYPDRMVRYALPGSMTREIVSFDRAGVMAPGEYRLKPPPAFANGLRPSQVREGRSQEAVEEAGQGCPRRRCPSAAASRHRPVRVGAHQHGRTRDQTSRGAEVRAHDRRAEVS